MLFKFDNFAIDTERRELRGPAGSVHVEPQVFDLLLHFVQNRDRVISKDELVEHIWNGRAISDAALNSRINAARRAIGDTGERQALIRTIPRRGFLFAAEVMSDRRTAPQVEAQVTVAPTPALPDKPSIAVLPFQNLSGDPEQEYFADGIVEEIITALSRFRHLFVIACNSSFSYKGRAIDVKEIGRTLGVRYVLEGSVRKAQARVRIAGQLIEAATGKQLWADRFDGALENIFDLQDQVTACVVGAIAPMVEQAEIERARLKPTENLDAYDLFLRGLAKTHQQTDRAINEALQLFHKATELDAGFGSAYGMAAYCFLVRRVYLWMTDEAAERAETTRLARRAAESGWDDALALARGGHALATSAGDLDGAAAMIDRARSLNPNLAVAWYASGWLRNLRGESETAIEHFGVAMRLSPRDPETCRMQAGMAFASFLLSRYDEALGWAQSASMQQPRYPTPMEVAAASAALAGRLDTARTWIARLRDVRPDYRVSDFKKLRPLQRVEDLARYEDGLRKAGLPE